MSELGPGALDVVYQRATHVGWTPVDDSVVLFDPMSDEGYVLNVVAGLLWQCLDGVSVLRDVFEDMAAEFVMTIDEVGDNLLPTLATWLEKGLILDRRMDDRSWT